MLFKDSHWKLHALKTTTCNVCYPACPIRRGPNKFELKWRSFLLPCPEKASGVGKSVLFSYWNSVCFLNWNEIFEIKRSSCLSRLYALGAFDVIHKCWSCITWQWRHCRSVLNSMVLYCFVFWLPSFSAKIILFIRYQKSIVVD